MNQESDLCFWKLFRIELFLYLYYPILFVPSMRQSVILECWLKEIREEFFLMNNHYFVVMPHGYFDLPFGVSSETIIDNKDNRAGECALFMVCNKYMFVRYWLILQVGYDKLGARQNATVAVMSYSGYDIEDAIWTSHLWIVVLGVALSWKSMWSFCTSFLLKFRSFDINMLCKLILIEIFCRCFSLKLLLILFCNLFASLKTECQP